MSDRALDVLGWTSLAVLSLLLFLYCKACSTIGNQARRKDNARHLLVVLGSGGHTGEMMRMLNTIDLSRFTTRYYYITSGDKLSADKARAFETTKGLDGTHTIRTLPRARRVKQSWLTTPLTTAVSSIACWRNVLGDRPDLILCNGPGTCVPIVLSAWLIRVSQTSGAAMHSSSILTPPSLRGRNSVSTTVASSSSSRSLA